MEAEDTAEDIARRRGYSLAWHFLLAATFTFSASLVAAYRASGSITSDTTPSEFILNILGVSLFVAAAQVALRTWMKYGVSFDDDDDDE